MIKKIIKNMTGISLVLAFSLANTLPASAFYMEVPPELKEIKRDKKVKTLLAQEGTLPSPDSGMPNYNPNYSQPNPDMYQPGSDMSQPGPNMYQPGPNQNMDQPNTGTCNINGQEVPCPPNGNHGQMEADQKRMEEMRQKDEERMKQDQERQMKNMQNGIRNMKNNMTRLERMFAKAENDKIIVPDEIKERLKTAREMINKMEAAKSPEEMQDMDMGELDQMMRDLDQARMEIIDMGQKLIQMKKEIKNMENGLKMFESQVNRLAKKKISILPEIAENIKKIKEILTAVKNAKNWSEAEEAGIENLQELMQSLDEYRGQLEMLSRWPQTQKEMERELKRITQDLANSKKLVARAKNNVDLSDAYATYEDAVNKLKAAKEDAIKKAAAGEWDEVFDILENDFFGQLEDAWQNSKIIQVMGNLGQFQTSLKRELNAAQKMIYTLQRKKIDTKELEKLLIYMKQRGEEIKTLIKVKPIDTDAALDALMEMEGLRQDFDSMVAEITGEEEERPWEKGPDQFQAPKMPSSWNNIMPLKPKLEPVSNEEENSSSPTPANKILQGSQANS